MNVYVYLYLKLTDPGPKNQPGWDFTYPPIEITTLRNKIKEIKQKTRLHIHSNLLPGDEIPNEELLSQVKFRHLYTDFYSEDVHLVRGLQCHYNFEKCGQYILKKEKDLQCKFDTLVYIRPDLKFINSCERIEHYDPSVVTLGNGPFVGNIDHIAIIPRKWLCSFFFRRMNTYRTNTTTIFHTAEQMYTHTIDYIVRPIGEYYIQRS